MTRAFDSGISWFESWRLSQSSRRSGPPQTPADRTSGGVPLSAREIELNLADISTGNATGAQGAGKLGRVGAPAVYLNALAVVGDLRTVDMATTSERPWRAMRAK